MADTSGSIEMAHKRVSRKCAHGKEKYRCCQCGGASLCSHGKQKYLCKPCGGKGICSHGFERRRCLDCGGTKKIAKKCQHGRAKTECRDCHGKAICEHDKFRKQCRLCHGSSICAHDKIKYQCRDCLQLFCAEPSCKYFGRKFSSRNSWNHHVEHLHGRLATFNSTDNAAGVNEDSCHDEFGNLEALSDEEFQRRLAKAFSEQV